MATYYVYDGGSNTAPYDTWAKAADTLAIVMAVPPSAGDTIVIASDHSEAAIAAPTTWTFPGTVALPCLILCVDRGTAGPTFAASDLRTMTNSIGTTGTSNNLTITGSANSANIFYGIKFQTGTSTNNANIAIIGSSTQQFMQFSNCSFTLAGSGNSQYITFGSTTAAGQYYGRFENCSFVFGNVANGFQFINADMTFLGGSVAATGSIPTTMIVAGSGHRTTRLTFDGVDLSAFSTGKTLVPAFSAQQTLINFNNCRLNATLPTLVADQTWACNVIFSRTAGSGVVTTLAKYGLNGNHQAVTNVVRTGGYADPASTAASWLFTTTANCKRYVPFEATAVSRWVAAGTYTCTIYGILNAAAVPNTDEVWVEFTSLGNASYPQSTVQRDDDAVPFVLNNGVARDADTSAWDTGATARANSTAYSLGDVIKVASNSGRIFFCTTAGTSNGSEPAGYATAIDGGSVTDGTAVFRAGCRFKMSRSITTALNGPITAKVFAGKASFAQLYIDPKIEAV